MKKNFINIQLFAEGEEEAKDMFTIEMDDDAESEEPVAEVEEETTDNDELTDEDEEIEIEDDDSEVQELDEDEDESDSTEDNADEEEEQETADETEEEAETEEEGISENSRKALEKQVKDTLEALGISVDGSIEDALIATAAEAKGISVEDYKAEKAVEAASQIQKQRQIEEMLNADLLELKKAFPSLIDIEHISKIDNFKDFGALRDKGLTVKQAYLAVNGDKLTNSKQALARQEAIAKSKNHLQSVTQKNAVDKEKFYVPKTEWSWLRDMFPNKSDTELAKIYKKAKN